MYIRDTLHFFLHNIIGDRVCRFVEFQKGFNKGFEHLGLTY